MANGAVRFFIGLRFVDLYMYFKKGDANGHHKVESVAENFIFELGDSCCFSIDLLRRL